MTSRDFAFWLQGFFEITNPDIINKEQTEMIERHLNLVFKHEIDPSMGDENYQEILNEIHKPTLQELGKEHGFPVTSFDAVKFGAQSSSDHVLGLHGWYNPKEGQPRC